ncbi:hypothetical protein QE152_g39697, partial [Popillia japonica]
MKSVSDKTHPPANVTVAIPDVDKPRDNVTVPIPDVDKPKGSFRNVIAVILLKTDDNMYQLGTREGIINHLYARSEFDICKQKFIDTREGIINHLYARSEFDICKQKFIDIAEVTQNKSVLDKPKGSFRNVIAVILLKTDDNMYQLGTREGIINHLYARSEFDICKQKFIDIAE